MEIDLEHLFVARESLITRPLGSLSSCLIKASAYSGNTVVHYAPHSLFLVLKKPFMMSCTEFFKQVSKIAYIYSNIVNEACLYNVVLFSFDTS